MTIIRNLLIVAAIILFAIFALVAGEIISTHFSMFVFLGWGLVALAASQLPFNN